MSNWKTEAISEFGEVISGGTPATNIAEYWGGNVVWVTPADLSKIHFAPLWTSEKKISTIGLSNSSANLIPKKSIVISSRAPIGYIAVPEVDFSTNQGCKSVKLKPGHDPIFHYFNFKQHIEVFKRRGEGTTFAEISKKEIEKLQFSYPPLSHQRKIARILTTVDNIIEKTEAAIAKYKAIKQGMMHDLFTRGIDVKTGKLRPKFEDAPELYKESELGWIPKEWEVDELETVSDEKQYSFTGGPFGSDLQTKDYEVTGVRIIQLQNIGDGEFLNSYKIFTSENKANQLYSCNIFPGDIILSKMADPVARACIIPNFHKRYLMASDGIRLKLSRNNNSIFIKEQINYYPFRRRAIALSTGTTRARIGLTELRRILIKIPQSIEQEAIGSKLETIDNIIEKEAIMKAKLIVQKSGLMQDLLTGKKEVTPDPEDYANDGEPV